ncbi:MAG TPA: hypothetical protein VD994_14505, partial [Prosthecobacter sp.]|nr:hypothetical protein [Prosthecobacter sp.]
LRVLKGRAGAGWDRPLHPSKQELRSRTAIRVCGVRVLEETRSARRSLPTMTWLGLVGPRDQSGCWVGIDRRAMRGLWGASAGGNAECPAVTPHHDVAGSCGC